MTMKFVLVALLGIIGGLLGCGALGLVIGFVAGVIAAIPPEDEKSK